MIFPSPLGEDEPHLCSMLHSKRFNYHEGGCALSGTWTAPLDAAAWFFDVRLCTTVIFFTGQPQVGLYRGQPSVPLGRWARIRPSLRWGHPSISRCCALACSGVTHQVCDLES